MEDRAIARAVSRRPFTADSRVRSQADSCGNFAGQRSTETGVCQNTSFPPLSSFYQCSVLIDLSPTVYEVSN